MENILKIDDISRLSITIKDGSSFGEDNYTYVVLEGIEERLNMARKELSKISEFIQPEEKLKIQNRIEKERSDVLTGLGSIFG